MNSKYLTLFSGFLFIILLSGHYELFRKANKLSVNTEREKEEEEESGIPKKDRMDLAWQQEFELTKDPATNDVPRERLIRAFAYAQQLAASHANKTSGAITGITWRERGPNNVGGRTRAIMVDPNDPTKKTVWAGSVGGGLWKTTDITAASPNWMPVNDLMGNLAVTSIVYNPANTQVMYFGTGEGVYNADAIRGLGIWKSTDEGATWSQLASTNNSNFYYTQRLAVASNGDIYAATSTGLRRSQNGGSTWSQVLGSGNGAATNSMGDVEIAANGTIYCGAGLLFSTDGVYKSATGNTGSWVKCNTGANGFPTTDLQRIKLACAPSNANVVYALCENGAYAIKGIYKTTDAGANWTACALPVDADGGIGNDFTRGQAWYDLSMAVDPNNANTLIVGGVDLFKSTNGGTSWTQISHWYGGFGYQEVHADQHVVLYEPGNSNVVYFGNDGGVWMSTNGNSVTPNIISKNDNYNVTQFYAGALNPGYHNNQMMSGAQDNGTNQTNSAAIGNSVEVTGGDGCFCHIDQDQPQYQFSSYVYNNYYRSVNSGVSFAGITSNNTGSFVNPTDYDDANNNLYACHANGDYYVMNNAPVSATLTAVAVAAFGTGKVTHISVSPNTSNRVFFGLNNGYVVRVDNAHTTTPTATNIRVAAMPATSVSCIAVEKGNDNHLLATYSSYGVNSVWETTNGGSTWTSVEGNLPDMPVRWAMFSPVNNQQAMLATELGVWSTDILSGGTTLWGPSNTGLANVRVDMLQFRNSDSLIMAITHGRGNYTTDAFMSSSPDFTSDKVIAYNNKPIKFIDASYRANSWYWDFGDGTSSTLQNPTKNYSAAGLYTVTLTINGNLQKVRSNYIQILPNRGTPYTPADGGSFDVNPLDFGADNFSGTSWQRGNSATAGKNGVFSGSNAWVTGLTGNYADNTDSRLMTPNFNLSAAGAYTLKLYRKNSFEIGYDGMRVEYTLDKGDSWLPLATTTSAGWYDFSNAAATTAFPIGQAYFNNTQSSFLLCQYNISSLAGNSNVAFRVRFKSDGSAVAAGAAIDNFEITGSVNTPLPVSLISFTGENKSDVNQLKWITSNEINNSGFEVYRSIDAILFEKIGFVPASTVMSVYHNYSFNDTRLNSNTYYYKLNQVDINGNKHVSPVIVIKSKLNNLAEVNIFPQPASEYLNVDINEPVKEPVELKIYNLNGQLVFSKNYESEDQHLIRLNVKEIQLARNCYLLVLKTGSESFARKFIVE